MKMEQFFSATRRICVEWLNEWPFGFTLAHSIGSVSVRAVLLAATLNYNFVLSSLSLSLAPGQRHNNNKFAPSYYYSAVPLIPNQLLRDRKQMRNEKAEKKTEAKWETETMVFLMRVYSSMHGTRQRFE